MGQPDLRMGINTGYPVGLIGNNGPLFSESSSCAVHSTRNQQNILSCFSKHHWLHGRKDFEHSGIVKTDQMINAVLTQWFLITVILGNSDGLATT